MVTKRIAPLLFTVAASLTAAAVGAGVLGGGMSVSPGVALAGSVRTYATLAALAAAPTSGLTAGATATVTNLGTYTYAPTCPATCTSPRCVTAAGVDGGMGCWTVPQAVAACTQALWTINPSTGSDSAAGTNAAPLATLQEWSRRVSSCTVNVQMTVTMAGSAAINGDYPAFPSIGPQGYLTLDCQPGATVIYTSSASGFTTVATASGNTPNIMTDTAATFTTACSGGSCVGYRIRVTAGARVGTIAWIVAVTAHTITISDPELDPWISTPTTRPIPNSGDGLTSKVLAVGDQYVIEQLALINTPSWPASINGDNSNYDSGRLVVHSCASSVTVQYPTYSQAVLSDTIVPMYQDYAQAVWFIGSYPGWITGSFTAAASLWDDYGFATWGQPAYVYGCAFLGDSQFNGTIFVRQGSVNQDLCGTTCPYANGSGVEFGSPHISSMYQLGETLNVYVGASLIGTISGPGPVCATVAQGAQFWSGAGYNCGDAGATSLAGTVFPWSAIADAGYLNYKGAQAGN